MAGNQKSRSLLATEQIPNIRHLTWNSWTTVSFYAGPNSKWNNHRALPYFSEHHATPWRLNYILKHFQQNLLNFCIHFELKLLLTNKSRASSKETYFFRIRGYAIEFLYWRETFLRLTLSSPCTPQPPIVLITRQMSSITCQAINSRQASVKSVHSVCTIGFTEVNADTRRGPSSGWETVVCFESVSTCTLMKFFNMVDTRANESWSTFQLPSEQLRG